MKKFIYTFLCLFFIGTIHAQEPTTFILVRHAEKAMDDSSDPPLNDSGKSRAIKLAETLAKQEIDALYATPFKRTRETLQPVADAHQLKIQSYAPYAKDEWLASLIRLHMGGTVVICGHSNTIPVLANVLLGSEIFDQFDEREYDNLIILMASKPGDGKLLHLQF